MIHVLYGHRSLPDIVVQHLLQIYVVIVIQAKRVPHNVCHLHPGIDEDDLYNLKTLFEQMANEYQDT